MLLMEIKLCTSCLTNDLSIVKLMTIIIFQSIRFAVPIYIIVKSIINLGKCENKNNKEFIVAKNSFINNLLKATVIYLIFTFIQFSVSILADFFSANIWICIRNLISF